MNKQYIYILATYAGALPFVACAIMLYSGINELSLLGSIDKIVAICGLILVSFIAGIHLGTYLLYETKTHKSLLIVSNVLAVIAWCAVMFATIQFAIAIITAVFGYLLVVDFLLKREKIISANYFITRFIVTLISAATLLVTASAS